MGQRELSAAELRTLHELEGRFAAQDPVLDAELRDGCPRPVTPPANRLAVLLAAGCSVTGLVTVLAGPQAGMSAVLAVLAFAAVSTGWWRLRHHDLAVNDVFSRPPTASGTSSVDDRRKRS